MANTATTRVLHVSELLRIICGLCLRKSLTRLARVSKLFLEPSLDIIWLEPGLIQAFTCLPEECWSIETRKSDWFEDVRVLKMKAWPIERDWLRFKYYSRRVKSLKISEPDYATEELDQDTYQMLIASCNDDPLFPNISNLNYTYHPSQLSFSHLRLFLTPLISNLVLDLDDCQERELAPFLQHLHYRCPHIRKIDLVTAHTITQSTRDPLSTSICQWNGLRVVDVPTLTEEAFSYLSSLTSLESLHISRCREELLIGDWSSSSFPALSTLSISAPVSYCCAALKAVSHSPLDDIHLTVLGHCDLPSWQELLIGVSKSTHLITSIEIMEEDYNPSAMPLQISHLRPLLKLQDLQTVELYPSGKFDLEDDDFKEIACAWPSLHDLTLGDREQKSPTGAPSKPRATINGLAHFVKRCPAMYAISIQFDATVLKDEDPSEVSKRPADGHYNDQVEAIRPYDCPIANPPAVASFLSSIFPNLRCILDEGDSLPVDWETTERLVPYFQSARRQERAEEGECVKDEGEGEKEAEGSPSP